MGHYVFKLPDVGEGTAEAELVAWHVKVGDQVEEEQMVAEVMTEKATVEIPAPVAGTVVALNGEPGEKLAVGSELMVFELDRAGNDGASIAPASAPSLIVNTGERTAEPQPAAPLPRSPADFAERAAPAPSSPPRAGSTAAPTGFTTRTPGERPVASPAVRRRADELGVKLQFVPGSGPGGRITHEDLEAYVASRPAIPPGPSARPGENHGVEAIKIVGLRRKIAEKMQEAKRRIPHFSYIEEIDVTAVEQLRQHLNATRQKDQPKLTFLPFLMRSLVKALPAFPQINARFDDDAGVVHRHQGIHVGIATQTASGLVVPVLRHAEALDLWRSATELARLANAAREGKAKREELSGSTITITSLGPLGALATTPVINYPEVAIIGVNKMAERPMVIAGRIVVRKMMNLSSSFDHRVVDGVEAAEFIQRVRGLLEHPATLFMDW